jgi:hypothetical protein
LLQTPHITGECGAIGEIHYAAQLATLMKSGGIMNAIKGVFA